MQKVGQKPFGVCVGARLWILFLVALGGVTSLAGEDQRLARAQKCMDFMLYDEAISLFDQILEKNPAERGLRVKQAYAYFRLNNYDKATAALNREREAFPDDLQPLVLLSFVQYAAGREDEAVRTARTAQDALDAILNSPDRKKAEATKRSLSLNAGLPSYILGLAEKKKLDAVSARSWFARAMALQYVETDCWTQAIDAAIEARSWTLALRLCDAGGVVPTESAAPQPAAAAPVPADVLTLKAIILAQLGRREECRAALEAAVAAEPFRADVLKNLALDDIRRSDFEGAVRLLTRVKKMMPMDFQARFLLEQAQAHRRLADGSAASGYSRDFMKARGPRFRYVLAGRPGEAVAMANNYALNLIQRGLLADAARHLRMFSEIYENSPTIYYDLGQLDNTQGLFAEALACGVKAVEMKNEYTDAYDLMGNVYFKVGDFENAVRSYDNAVRLNTRDPLSFFNLGCALHELGDDANAEKNWQEAVRLENVAAAGGAPSRADPDALEHSLLVHVEPVSAPSCQYLGLLYAGRGKTAQAIEYLEKAIAFNPNSLIPYLEIGRLYLEQNERRLAEQHFKTYLELGGDENKVKALRKK